MRRVRLDPSSRTPLKSPVEKPRAADRCLGNDLAPKPVPPYVELTSRTNFSFLQAASSPEGIVARAHALGYDAVAVVDRDGLYGIVRAMEEAERLGVRLIVGCEVTFRKTTGGSAGLLPSNRPSGEGHAWSTLTLLVENHTGYENLCRILTESHGLHAEERRKGKSIEGLPRNVRAGLPLERLVLHPEGLWALAAPLEDGDVVAKLKEAFGPRLSLAVHRHKDGADRARVRWAESTSALYGVPVCATNAVRFARREEKPVLDVLHCIREGMTLDRAGRQLLANAEACLKSPEEIAKLFPEHEAWLRRSREIADACRFSMRELKYRFPSEGLCQRGEGPGREEGPLEDPNLALRRRTWEGARLRYGVVPPKVRAQLEKELALIEKLEVAPYFSSVADIVEIARSRDILCQGRGSAANSAVCYCLGVTAVDPARSNLLFERFLSAERHEPPDIDVDFEHERREEVIQEIYARYGRDRAAMVSEVICYRGKSALREVGKVFGLSLEQVDRLSGLVAWWDGIEDIAPERMRQAGFSPTDTRVKMTLAMARAIQGFPRHLSIHVGGFVLSSEPLVNVAPIEPATMPDRTIIPWDKDDLDTLGFFKVDVLGLGMLTAIRKALDFVNDDPRISAGTAIDRLAKIPPEDPLVYEALCHADTVGVFQIESRAQMAMLPRLKPRTFYDLVVEVAIVRPGPIQGGMVHPYLRRRNGEEACDPPHPTLAPILDRTLGVPLFQEQVMQIAIVGAGYTGGQADQLRRDMAAWRKNGRLEAHRDRLLQGFAERGIGAEFGERLFSQIRGFGEYGFPESHAASFALLVYASSWLKVHHPAAFAAALVNSQPMGFYSPSTILQDAQRHGVGVLSIDVNASDWDCTLEGPKIRVGLRQVRGLGEEVGRRIARARPFASVEDLKSRAGVGRRELELLAESGALDAIVSSSRAPELGPPAPRASSRRDAMWKVRAPESGALFAGLEAKDARPELPPMSRAEQLVLDYERTGLSVNDRPMKLLRPQLPRRAVTSRELVGLPQGRRVQTAGMVICRQRPGTASGVVFVTMEDEHGFINLILWAKVFEQFRHVATASTLLLAHGKVEREGEVVYIVVEKLEPLAMRVPEARPVAAAPSMSRDFH
jgi:error-prone DNA polymerase